jgi:hypothetical protein
MARSAASTDELHAIGVWRRRVGGALFVGGCVDGFAVLAVGAAATLLALRLFGFGVEPHPLWGAALVLPLAQGALRARRGLPTQAQAALQIDRRLGLDSHLVTGTEVDASAWRSQWAPRLAGLEAALPRLKVTRLLVRALPAAALLATVLLLPPPSRAPARGVVASSAVTDALERFEEKLGKLEEEKALLPEVREELRDRLQALQERVARADPVPWSEVDNLHEKLEREQGKTAASLAKTRATAASLAARGGQGEDGRPDREQAARMLEAAREAGLTETLSPELSQAVESAEGPDEAVDAGLLPDDAETLQALAEALGATAGERLAQLATSGVISAEDVAELEKLLASDPQASPFSDAERACALCRGAAHKRDACPSCQGTGKEAGRGAKRGEGKPGSGGIQRGRADADLEHTGATEGDSEGLAPQRLPAGAKAPQPSVRLGVSRGEPTTSPIRDEGSGGAGGAGGEGYGAATWHRRLAPHVRDVVRGFFRDAPGDAGR